MNVRAAPLCGWVHVSPRATIDTLGSIRPAKTARNPTFEQQDHLPARHPAQFRQPTRQIGPIMKGEGSQSGLEGLITERQRFGHRPHRWTGPGSPLGDHLKRRFDRDHQRSAGS